MAGEIFDQDTVSVRQGGALRKLSARWCCVLVAMLLAAPLLSAKAVGEGGAAQPSLNSGLLKAAASPFPSPRPVPSRPPTPLPARPSPPVPRATVTPAPPPPAPLPAVQPPAAPSGFCADALSIHVVDAELFGVVQAGVDLLTPYFGCQRFRIDGTGLPVKFGPVTPLLNARVLGYAHSTPESYEIWINPDCWGVVGDWSGVVAHELGHYLGWQHGDDHPYMWLAPPPGSYAQPSDLAIVCY